jgi:hypothetical protein
MSGSGERAFRANRTRGPSAEAENHDKPEQLAARLVVRGGPGHDSGHSSPSLTRYRARHSATR